MSKNQREKLINIILLLIASVLVISNLILFLKFNKKEEKSNTVENNIISQENKEEVYEVPEEEDVSEMTEQERMELYVNNFFDKIEKRDYETAYNYLNQDFRNNYFNTLDSFKEYCEENFKMTSLAIEFNNIERLGNPVNGNMYVLWINILNIFEKSKEQTEEQDETNFVILEKGYNDFELSFSVKK